MKPLLSILILIAPMLAHASQPHCGHFQLKGHNNGYVAAPAHHQQYQIFAAVGYNTQIEAEVARGVATAIKPLTEKIDAQAALLNAIRSEQKTAFASLFKFRGVGQITFEGGNDPGPVQPPPVNPPVVDPPGPAPSADRGPPLTDYMRNLLTVTCATCHNEQSVRSPAFVPDENGTLEANRSVEVWGRLWNANPAVMMPPTGSTEEMRLKANEWFLPSQVKGIESEILSRKGK